MAEPEILGDIRGATLTARIDRDGARPAPILADEDVAIEIDTEIGPPTVVAANLRQAAAVLMRVADELIGPTPGELAVVDALADAAPACVRARPTWNVPPFDA